VRGVGAGGFNREFARRNHLVGHQQKRAASHTTPVTVAAEEGFVGLALLAWLLAAAFGTTLVGLGRGFTSRVSLAVGVVLVAVFVHSLFYNAFFEDPTTWAMLGLAGLVSRVPRKPRSAGPPDYAPAEVTGEAEQGGDA
jgi:hypothetical protein